MLYMTRNLEMIFMIFFDFSQNENLIFMNIFKSFENLINRIDTFLLSLLFYSLFRNEGSCSSPPLSVCFSTTYHGVVAFY